MQPIIIKINGAGKLLFIFSFILFSNNIFSQQAWTRVPVPDTSSTRNILNSISGTSSSDVWVVGNFESTPAGNLRNQVLHWNGAGWESFTGTDLSATYNDLRDISAISATDIWAVGSYNEPGTTRSQLMHWDGNDWSHTSLPAIQGGSFLNAVKAISTNDVWAVGGQAGSPTRPAYTIHYNGSGWTEFTAASPGTFRNYFNALDAKVSGDLWAVGYYSDSYGDFHAMAQHWNGSTWTNSVLPASVVSPLGELSSVTVIASNDVWALGSTITGTMLMIHWDGSNWSEISNAGSAGGIVLARGSDVFSVGDRISQWNGSSWSVIDPLNQLSYPSLVSGVVFSNGDIWVCGRTYDTSFLNLVYRTANAVPQFTHGSIQYMDIPLTMQNIDQRLNVLDPDISQVVTYTLMSMPSFGTISGLPDTAITSNGFAISAGANYLRNTGYTGTDQFVVEAAVGNLRSQTTIMVNPIGALPVLLDQYVVVRSGNSSVMKWRTVTEENSREFIMERSTDGFQFSPVNRVPAYGSAHSYTLTDPAPMQGLNFYRLKLIDLDNRETNFEIRSLVFDPQWKAFTVTHNPTVGRMLSIKINLPGNYYLFLYDQEGKMVFSKFIDSSTDQALLSLPAGISTGVYVVTMIDKVQRWTEKIMVR